jgi:predicted dithiol-disulfide oxidoreductase (DUF899 family)
MACGRLELLDAEQQHMRLGDELARRRRELPWVPVEKEYMMGTFGYLDVAPLGRNEDPQNPAAWWRRHHEYASH